MWIGDPGFEQPHGPRARPRRRRAAAGGHDHRDGSVGRCESVVVRAPRCRGGDARRPWPGSGCCSDWLARRCSIDSSSSRGLMRELGQRIGPDARAGPGGLARTEPVDGRSQAGRIRLQGSAAGADATRPRMAAAAAANALAAGAGEALLRASTRSSRSSWATRTGAAGGWCRAPRPWLADEMLHNGAVRSGYETRCPFCNIHSMMVFCRT